MTNRRNRLNRSGGSDEASGDSGKNRPQPAAPDTPTPAIMQRENERSRIVVAGRRVDDNTRCTLVVIQEVGGMRALYPHGWGKFGVRLAKPDAVNLAQAVLDRSQ